MVRFARAAQMVFQEAVKSLELTLGPDTGGKWNWPSGSRLDEEQNSRTNLNSLVSPKISVYASVFTVDQ
jgi:hypothetical protein